MSVTRLTREEAFEYIGCKKSKFNELLRAGLLEDTYYTIGERKIYIAEKLDEWMLNGGESGAMARMGLAEVS